MKESRSAVWCGVPHSSRGDGRCRRLFIGVAFLTAIALHPALAALEPGDERVTWDEDVVLRSGEVMTVERSMSFGPDQWAQPGKGPIREQTISFLHNRKRVIWTNRDHWPIYYLPRVLEVVNGEPVVVMPVFRLGPCLKYGFPQGGLVAFRYRDGHWHNTGIGDLPPDTAANLLVTTHQLRHSPRGRKVTPQDKARLEVGASSPRQGTRIGELAGYYAEIDESCARLKPPPNPEMEARRMATIEAERKALIVETKPVSSNFAAEPITAERFRAQYGGWRGTGIYSGSCKGIVERIELLNSWFSREMTGGWNGYQIVLAKAPKDSARVPLEESSGAQLQGTICNSKAIFVVRRRTKQELIIHRFTHDGHLIDALKVHLAGTEKVVSSNDWGILLTAEARDDGGFLLTLVDYTYPQLMTDGGTIRSQATYLFRYR